MNYTYDYSVYDHTNAESREYSTLEEAKKTAKAWKKKGHRVDLTYERVDEEGNVSVVKHISF